MWFKSSYLGFDPLWLGSAISIPEISQSNSVLCNWNTELKMCASYQPGTQLDRWKIIRNNSECYEQSFKRAPQQISAIASANLHTRTHFLSFSVARTDAFIWLIPTILRLLYPLICNHMELKLLMSLETVISGWCYEFHMVYVRTPFASPWCNFITISSLINGVLWAFMF